MNLAAKCAENVRKREYGVLDKHYRRYSRPPKRSQKRFGYTLTVNFNKQHHDGLVTLAGRQGVTASELVRRAIQQVYFS